MPITLDLDDDALSAAMAAAPGRSQAEVINEALREYARRRRLRGFLAFEGKLHWDGNLDELRRRERMPKTTT